MSVADWYLALFSIGSGGGIIGFWVAVFARGRLSEVAGGRDDIGFHAAAELLTGVVLVVAGVMGFVDADDPSAVLLSALALGMLAYSLLQSPGHYFVRGDRRMLVTFALSWVMAVPAVVLRFVS